MSCLTFNFHCIPCNGYPSVRIAVNGQLQITHMCSQSREQLTCNLPTEGPCVITVERYGKNHTNMVLEQDKIVQDQILEIESVLVDGVTMPNYILTDLCKFEWDDNCHSGSLYFGPNGTWTLPLVAPVLSFLLDLKIQHESNYNQDYLYPWSYRLGPGQAEHLIALIDEIEQRVYQVL